jgi:hypothetical protein
LATYNFFRKRNFYSDFCKSFAHNKSLLQFFQAFKIKPQLSKSKLNKGATLCMDPLKRRPPVFGEDLQHKSLLQFFQAFKIKPQLSKSKLSKGATLCMDPLKRRPPVLGEDLQPWSLVCDTTTSVVVCCTSFFWQLTIGS